MKRILGLLCLVAGSASIGCGGDDLGTAVRKETTRQTIAALDHAITAYKNKTNKVPTSLTDLAVGVAGDKPLVSAEMFNDAWGNPLELSVNAAMKHTIRSAGPDGQMNTEDDITN